MGCRVQVRGQLGGGVITLLPLRGFPGPVASAVSKPQTGLLTPLTPHSPGYSKEEATEAQRGRAAGLESHSMGTQLGRQQGLACRRFLKPGPLGGLSGSVPLSPGHLSLFSVCLCVENFPGHLPGCVTLNRSLTLSGRPLSHMLRWRVSSADLISRSQGHLCLGGYFLENALIISQRGKPR